MKVKFTFATRVGYILLRFLSHDLPACVLYRLRKFLLALVGFFERLMPSQVLFDGGTALDYLKIVRTWLDASQNQNEVLTLLITNPENIPLSTWATVFQQSGIAQVAYIPPHVPMARQDVRSIRGADLKPRDLV